MLVCHIKVTDLTETLHPSSPTTTLQIRQLLPGRRLIAAVSEIQNNANAFKWKVPLSKSQLVTSG